MNFKKIPLKITSVFIALIIVISAMPIILLAGANTLPIFDSELHTAYTEKMTVTRNDVQYNYSGTFNENSKSGNYTYAFNTELSKTKDFFLSATVKTQTENVFWAGARFVVYKGANQINGGTKAEDYVYFIFRGDGAYIMGISSGEKVIAKNTDIKRELNRNYSIVLKVEREKLSVWIDGEIVFDKQSLMYSSGDENIDFTNMPNATQIVLANGDGSGRRATNTTVSELKIWSDKLVEYSDEPVFDKDIHTDYAFNGQYTVGSEQGTYSQEPITESGLSGYKRYIFKTALTSQAEYVFTASVNTATLNTFWSGVRFVLRRGNNYKENGVTGGELYLIHRDDGLFLIGTYEGEKIIAKNTDFKRIKSFNYRITVKTTADTVSVWVDGKKAIDTASLVWSNGNDTVDFSGLTASPQLCFTFGDGASVISTMSTVSSVKIFNNPVTDNIKDEYSEPVYDPTVHTDYSDNMVVTRNGKIVETKSEYSETGNGIVNYLFDTGLTKAATYYYSAQITVMKATEDWTTPQLMLREGYTDSLKYNNYQLIFRKNMTGLVNEAGHGFNDKLLDDSVKLTEKLSYKLTVKSTQNQFSLWVDGALVFKDANLEEYSGYNAAPGIRFMLGTEESSAKVENIIIWNNGADENPPNVYDPTDEPVYNSDEDVNYCDTMSVMKEGTPYTENKYFETGEKGDVLYSFSTGLSKLSTYYMTFDVTYFDYANSWTVPHILLRSGVDRNNEYNEIYLTLRSNGCFIVNKKGSGLTDLADYTVKAKKDTTSKITVRSKPESVSVWIDGRLVFYEGGLLECSGMYSTPALKFRLGNHDTTGLSSSEIKNLIIWNDGLGENPEDVYNPTDEPIFDEKTDIDYFVGREFSVNSSLDKRFDFSTNLGRNATYCYSAVVTLNELAESWGCPQLILRKGVNSENKEVRVGVLLRTNCIAVVNETNTSLNSLVDYSVRATLGKDYRITVRCSAENISVWLDGKLIFLEESLGEYSWLKASPSLYFQCGNSKSEGTTRISVKNLQIWNNLSQNISADDHILLEDMISEFPEITAVRLKDAEKITAAMAFYNSMNPGEAQKVSLENVESLKSFYQRIKQLELCKDVPIYSIDNLNLALSAEVLKDDRPMLSYNGSSITENDSDEFHNYIFQTPLSSYESYWFSGTVNCTEGIQNWQRPRILFRGNGSHKLAVAFLSYGIYIMDNNSKTILKDTGFGMECGKEYAFTIYSTPTSISLWVDGEVIFANELLSGEYGNLPVYPGVTYPQAKGRVSDIHIWNLSQKINDGNIVSNKIYEYYLPISVMGNDVIQPVENKFVWDDLSSVGIAHIISSINVSDTYQLSGLIKLKPKINEEVSVYVRGEYGESNIRIQVLNNGINVIKSDGTVLENTDRVLEADKTYAFKVISRTDSFDFVLDGEKIFEKIEYGEKYSAVVPALGFVRSAGEVTELSVEVEAVKEKTVDTNMSTEENHINIKTILVLVAALLIAVIVCGVIIRRIRK